MDTFQSSTNMWLRDMLPTTDPFQTPRIMTFGYNSTLFEKQSKDRLQDRADYLLSNLDEARRDSAARNQPLILVCHSLGRPQSDTENAARPCTFLSFEVSSDYLGES